jgi:hypothetical protein
LKAPQTSLKNWGDQKWRTKSGKPSSKTGERYLPEAAIKSLSPAEYAATTKAKKAHVFDAQTDVDSSAADRRSALPRDFAIRAGKGGDKITASVQSVVVVVVPRTKIHSSLLLMK